MKHIYAPKLFLQLGFEHKQPKGTTWESKSDIRIIANKADGIPFGRAKIVVLYLAELVWESGSVVYGSIEDMCRRFGVEWEKYGTEKNVLRVLRSQYEQRTNDHRCCEGQCLAYQPLGFIDHYKYCKKTKSFVVWLNDAFVEQVQRGVRCERQAVMEFVKDDTLAALDLYVYYRWKLQRGDHRRVGMSGPCGPYAWLANAKNEIKQRQNLREHHKLVMKRWPACPFRLDSKRQQIVHRDKLLKERQDPKSRRRITKPQRPAVEQRAPTSGSSLPAQRATPSTATQLGRAAPMTHGLPARVGMKRRKRR